VEKRGGGGLKQNEKGFSEALRSVKKRSQTDKKKKVKKLRVNKKDFGEKKGVTQTTQACGVTSSRMNMTEGMGNKKREDQRFTCKKEIKKLVW